MRAADEAIILAGGFGTRLQGLIGELPKPLAPVAGRPFIAWILDALAEQGFRRVILATGYRADRVEAELGTCWRGLELAYSPEPDPRGTGGAIALAANLLEGDVCFVLNGDTMVRLDYAAFDRHVREHGAHGADRQDEGSCESTSAEAWVQATHDTRLGIALTQVPDVSRYGAVRVAEDRVAGFIEKGPSGPGYINAGVYWMHRSLLTDFPLAESFSFEADVLTPTVARERVVAFTDTSGFIDIGVPEDYQRAQHLFTASDRVP